MHIEHIRYYHYHEHSLYKISSLSSTWISFLLSFNLAELYLLQQCSGYACIEFQMQQQSHFDMNALKIDRFAIKFY